VGTSESLGRGEVGPHDCAKRHNLPRFRETRGLAPVSPTASATNRPGRHAPARNASVPFRVRQQPRLPKKSFVRAPCDFRNHLYLFPAWVLPCGFHESFIFPNTFPHSRTNRLAHDQNSHPSRAAASPSAPASLQAAPTAR
jgi:hypothetical protein